MTATPQGRWQEYPAFHPHKRGNYVVRYKEIIYLRAEDSYENYPSPLLSWFDTDEDNKIWRDVRAFYSIPIPPYQPKGDKHGKT